jgi:predicted GIY-YIG superfamily endonuclease
VDWFFYVVRCADSSLYAGVSTDVQRRVREHNSGARGAKYTRSRRPVSLAHYERFNDKGDALRREYSFKQLTRAEKLKVIKEGLND